MKKVYYVNNDYEVKTMDELRESWQDEIDSEIIDHDTSLQAWIDTNNWEPVSNDDVLAIADILDLNTDEIAEVLEKIESEDDTDFVVSGARIIHKDFIDKIQQDELCSDLYILGCFNASFLAEYLPISRQAIEAIQKADAYEALGEIVQEYIEEIQAGYAAADGYGHHFNGYDFSEEETDHYYIFPRAGGIR